MKSKYHNKKCSFGEYNFDSIKEKNRYITLLSLVQKGEIKDLVLQPRFLLQDKFKRNGQTYRKIEYVSDFQYFSVLKSKTIIEDVKASKTFTTDVYKIKKKLFLNLLSVNVEFNEVY